MTGQSDMQDRPYDPNDPSTWSDPSGNPVEGDGTLPYPPQEPINPAGAGLTHSVSTAETPSAPGSPATDPTEPTPAPSPAPTGDGVVGPAPGNDYNAVSGMYGKWTGMHGGNGVPASQIQAWVDQIGHGMSLSDIENQIANSAEAKAWAAKNATPTGGTGGGAPGPLPPSPGGGSPYRPPGIAIDPATSAYNSQLRQFMLSQLGKLSSPTTADSEEIAPAIAAYNTQSQRDQSSEREAVAERFYAMGANGGQGLNSGGFNSALTQGAEAAGLNRQNFSGSMVWNAAQSKRTQLQAMLQTAVGAGETDAAQQIQSQIASIDASLRAQGLSQQNSQFGDQLGLSYAQLIAQMNRDQMLAGLQGGG